MWRECSGVEKENLPSLAGDLGLVRSGSIEVARRPLEERPVFRLFRLRHELDGYEQWLFGDQANVKTSLDAFRMRRLTSSRQEESQLARFTTNPFKLTKQSIQSKLLTGSSTSQASSLLAACLFFCRRPADCKHHTAKASRPLSMSPSKISWQCSREFTATEQTEHERTRGRLG